MNITNDYIIKKIEESKLKKKEHIDVEQLKKDIGM